MKMRGDWKFYDGPAEVDIAVNACIEVQGSSEFTVISMNGTERGPIVGPFRVGDLSVKAVLPFPFDRIKVVCDKKCMWQLRWFVGPDIVEHPDPTPVSLGVKVKPESMEDMMRRIVRQEVSRVAVDEGFESFEEADDFTEEEEGLISPHELTEDQLLAELEPDGNAIESDSQRVDKGEGKDKEVSKEPVAKDDVSGDTAKGDKSNSA